MTVTHERTYEPNHDQACEQAYEHPRLSTAGRFTEVTRGRWGWGHDYFYRRFGYSYGCGGGCDGGGGFGGAGFGGGGGFVAGGFFF
ncbi:lasso RiPP family leader peptide-containing protein [Candidatus Frankia nodulisporulans]|uniref:lasso RiPP family leader peptide-containing protein n=1 Tax=Candidatus Frankia nodulisporulans TaxID=2060052 RepID=UPI0013D5F438|nr:lasso RiPP family leader peptide-containing protein [Candidatus Frankia nodulisporulans]